MPLVKNACSNFKIVDNYVELTREYLRNNAYSFKKITGSRFSAILGFNPYTSPFKIWFVMTSLYKDTMDPTLAYVGNAIEPKVRSYVGNLLNQKYLIYNPREIGWDAFKDNKIFGGIPDGEPINDAKRIDYSNNQRMIEIKTSSIDSFVYKNENGSLTMQKDRDGIPLVKIPNAKRNSWVRDDKTYVPDDYKLQLGLYLYLRKHNKGLFAVIFLQGVDYVRPDQCDIQQREIKLINVDYDLETFEKYINHAKQWYADHILTGKSPVMTETDKKWLENEMKIVS